MDAINDLKKEHEGIRLMLQVLQAVSRKLGRGERINAQHLGGIMEFLSIFVDKCHHGKEEEFLFPALEASGIPREGGPIGAMLAEHDQGRRIVSELRDAVKSYNSGDKSAADSIKEPYRRLCRTADTTYRKGKHRPFCNGGREIGYSQRQ
ncbi:MAG: hemerythrin domain-containing protein [Dissulfurimicrobium sp.]|uniref:hemerythrin domain-containing protein n=1 Tax=Dissulfurimicrobium sp. TaxID=2022436 RepID=UPI003D098FB2